MNSEEFQSLISQINLEKRVGENMREAYEENQKKLLEDRRAKMRLERLEEVDRLILDLDLPQKIREAKLNPKPYGVVEKIKVKNFRQEFVDRDCGSAKARPGSYTELLVERIRELGLKAECQWDYKRSFFGRKVYWAWIEISF